MQNNRDSSILRGLAVAFGDGLAFGVGMKLTQKTGRNEAPASDPAPAIDISPLLERLAAIEQRIGKVERTPMSIAAAPAPAPFDQKVLEAIVSALDARLAEQAGQVERRLTELEAKLAIELKLLQQQDHSVAKGVQSHIEDLNVQINDQLGAFRRRSDEERAAMHKDIAALHREFALDVEQAAMQAVEYRVAELRQEIASRDSRIAELQVRLEAGDERTRNVVAAIAQACQTATTRPSTAAKPALESAPKPPDESPLPGFAQPKPGPRALPLPLVSAMGAVCAAGLAMLHYLQ